MIKLIDRAVLARNKFFSYIIGALQKANRDSFALDIENEEDKRQYINKSKEIYDFIDYSGEYYRKMFVGNIILGINAANIDEYLSIFPDAFAGLMEKLRIDKLYFALSERQNWLGRRGKIKPLKETFKNLTRITKNKRYFEAFEVDKDSIKEFAQIIFMLGRYDASMSYLHILSDKVEAGFNICKYGNLHIEIYSKELETQIKSVLAADINLKIVQEEVDFTSDFDKRKIVV